MTRLISQASALLVATVVTGSTPAPARAQVGPVPLYLAFNDESSCAEPPEPSCQAARLVSATIDGPRSRVNWTRDIPAAESIQYGYVTPDGRFVAWFGLSRTAGPTVYLHDTVTGTTSSFGPFHGAMYLFGNPARPEVYLASNAGVTAFGPGGMRQIALPCLPFGLPAQLPGVSADGGHASIACAFGSDAWTAVFDTTSGATVTMQPGVGVVSAAGDALFLVDYVNGAYRLRRRALSGAILADVPHQGNGALKADVATGGVVAYLRSTPPNVFAIDGTTLTTTTSTTVAMSGFGNAPEPVLHEASGLVAAFFGGVDVADLRTGQLLVRAPLRGSLAGALVFGPPPPLAPVALVGAVTGSAVTLTWAAPTRPAAVTSYVLEVGSAPGLNDIFTGLDVGRQSSFAATGVPPGRYYVRVRAGNYAGLSAPSNEVMVQVP